MPIKKSAKKALRQNVKKEAKNIRVWRTCKDLIKKTRKNIVAENLAQAEELLQKTIKTLDKAAKKNIIKKNTANRHKSRLTKRLNLLKTGVGKTKK